MIFFRHYDFVDQSCILAQLTVIRWTYTTQWHDIRMIRLIFWGAIALQKNKLKYPVEEQEYASKSKRRKLTSELTNAT